MDIKRKLSPQLGDDLVIRIHFGEVQSIKSDNVGNGSPNGLGVVQGKVTGNGHMNNINNESKSNEIELTSKPTRGQYQEVPKEEDRKVTALEDPADGAL